MKFIQVTMVLGFLSFTVDIAKTASLNIQKEVEKVEKEVASFWENIKNTLPKAGNVLPGNTRAKRLDYVKGLSMAEILKKEPALQQIQKKQELLLTYQVGTRVTSKYKMLKNQVSTNSAQGIIQKVQVDSSGTPIVEIKFNGGVVQRNLSIKQYCVVPLYISMLSKVVRDLDAAKHYLDMEGERHHTKRLLGWLDATRFKHHMNAVKQRANECRSLVKEAEKDVADAKDDVSKAKAQRALKSTIDWAKPTYESERSVEKKYAEKLAAAEKLDYRPYRPTTRNGNRRLLGNAQVRKSQSLKKDEPGLLAATKALERNIRRRLARRWN